MIKNEYRSSVPTHGMIWDHVAQDSLKQNTKPPVLVESHHFEAALQKLQPSVSLSDQKMYMALQSNLRNGKAIMECKVGGPEKRASLVVSSDNCTLYQIKMVLCFFSSNNCKQIVRQCDLVVWCSLFIQEFSGKNPQH